MRMEKTFTPQRYKRYCDRQIPVEKFFVFSEFWDKPRYLYL